MSVICRACLQEVPKRGYYYINTLDNAEKANTMSVEMLQLCIPEMDLYISENPGVCNNCFRQFQSFYKFKSRCLASEEKILAYLKKHNTDPLSKVNLISVLSDNAKSSQIVEIDRNGQLIVTSKEVKGGLAGVEEELILSCNGCAFVTMDKDQLLSHRCPVTNPKSDKYKCSLCDFATNRKFNLKCHMNTKHSNSKWYNCKKCDFKTVDGGSLTRHQRVVHEVQNNDAPVGINNCPSCDFSSFSAFTLRRHQIKQHGPIMHSCPYCSYQTKDKSNFRKHSFIHGDRPIKCTKCDYQCVSPYQMQRHSLIHGGKPKKCTKCHFQTLSQYQMQKHIKKTH